MNNICYFIKIVTDIVRSNIYLSKYKNIVSIFGSSKININSPYYSLCINISKMLVFSGFTVFSGGGMGIMEAANKGAFNTNNLSSVGLNFKFLDKIKNNWQNLSLNFNFLFMRKASFFKYSKVCIIFPGGFGTIDELTEILVLSQFKKLYKTPIILVGSTFWYGLINWINTKMINNYLINKKDLNLFQVIDNPYLIVDIIKNFNKKN